MNITDTERLNWIENNAAKVACCADFEGELPQWRTYLHEVIDPTNEEPDDDNVQMVEHTTGDTLREAVDAAVEQQRALQNTKVSHEPDAKTK